MAYLLLKYLHVLGATVLLGTGMGIAFFMWRAHRSGDAAYIARTAETVVVADFLFTATAVAAQPVTGFLLAWQMGLPTTEGWVMASLVLYAVAGLFWLPVISFQMRMRDLAKEASVQGTPLPAEYHRLFRRWFIFGFPAFGAVAAIIWLMIAKPSL